MHRSLPYVVLGVGLMGGLLTSNPAAEGLNTVPSSVANQLFGGEGDVCIKGFPNYPCHGNNSQTCPWNNNGILQLGNQPCLQTIRVSNTKWCAGSKTCGTLLLWDLGAAGCTPPPESP